MTDQIPFLFSVQEEREKRLETMFDAGLDDGGRRPEDIPEEGAAGVAGRKTQDTISAVDSIIEALEMAESEIERLALHKVSQPALYLDLNHFLCTICVN